MGVRQVYMAAYTAPGGGLDVLEELLAGRQELAGLLGAPSWAHYQVLPWPQDGHALSGPLTNKTVQPVPYMHLTSYSKPPSYDYSRPPNQRAMLQSSRSLSVRAHACP